MKRVEKKKTNGYNFLIEKTLQKSINSIKLCLHLKVPPKHLQKSPRHPSAKFPSPQKKNFFFFLSPPINQPKKKNFLVQLLTANFFLQLQKTDIA